MEEFHQELQENLETRRFTRSVSRALENYNSVRERFESRRFTRSISRALENQIVGSIYNQIDTGIVRAVDFVPTDYLNRCANTVFGRTSERHLEPISSSTTLVSQGTLSFSEKLDAVCEMSEEDSNDPPLEKEKEVENVVLPTGSKSNRPHLGEENENDEANPLATMMRMLAQQQQMMAGCMVELTKVRGEVSGLSNRLAEVETSLNNSQIAPPNSASTPEGDRGAVSSVTQHNERENDAEQNRENRASYVSRKDEMAKSIMRFPNPRSIDLDRWNIKFDGTSKGMTVESFLFRIERMSERCGVTYGQLFTDFHCLVTGSAARWFWQVLEDHAGDDDFGYIELKRELLSQFESSRSDYELIREMIDRKQNVGESFDDFYAEIHDISFRLKKKIPEKELVGIVRENLRPNLASLTFSSRIESLADLRKECRRAEKLIKDAKTRIRPVHEVQFVDVEDEVTRSGAHCVEAFAGAGSGRQSSRIPSFSPQAKSVSASALPLNAGSQQQFGKIPNAASGNINNVFCPSPFHVMLCFNCGMPVDFFIKNPSEAQKDDRCKSSFHAMRCFACDGTMSFCVYRNAVGNHRLAEISGVSGQEEEIPESQSQQNV